MRRSQQLVWDPLAELSLWQGGVQAAGPCPGGQWLGLAEALVRTP